LRKDQVRWLGAPAYYASSKIARRGFCNRCGTPLSFEFLDSERMDLSVGSLDEPGQLKPTEHFAAESRIASWFHDDGLPCSRLDDNASINQRWRDAYGAQVQPGLAAVRAAGTIGSSSGPNKDTA
jgi:Glutathione-dependent formaldehyde-activating enzyme